MYNSLKENISTLKKMFKNSADFTVREMNLKGQCSIKSAIITIEGMCGKDTLALSVINPLLDYYFDCQSPDKVFDLIKNTVLTSSEIVEFTTIDEAISFSTSGFALLVVDGCSRMLAIGAQGFSFRSVSEPESEVVQRGCREGFTEPLRINMTLIRRRIKSPDLVFETITSGYSSNTQMMICYLQNSVSKQILKAIRERLENCNLKMILASGYLSSYLEDNNSKSLFSGVGISERPDTVCGKLSEGRVAEHRR